MTKIKYDQSSVDLLNQKISKLSAYFSDMSNKMTPFKESSLIGEGSIVLAGNVSILESRAEGNSRVISKGQDSFAEGELLNESLLDSIEIPTDLKNVYSPTDTNINGVTLDKRDGRSVNDGDLSLEQSLDFNRNIEKERLEYITNTNGLEEAKLNDYKDAQNIGLEAFNNRVSTEEQTLEDVGNTLNNKNLESINNNTILKEQDVNESVDYSINKQEIKDNSINNNNYLRTNYDDPFDEWSDK